MQYLLSLQVSASMYNRYSTYTCLCKSTRNTRNTFFHHAVDLVLVTVCPLQTHRPEAPKMTSIYVVTHT